MLDFSHIPTSDGGSDVQMFVGRSITVGATYEQWVRPRGKTMCSIFLQGHGGNGGSGVVGSNNSSAGGGGGGSGASVRLTMPLAMLPDILYLSLAGPGAINITSYITIAPSLTAGGAAPLPNNVLALAAPGQAGGNAATGTAGAAGVAGIITNMTAATMPLGWGFADTPIVGHVGTAGGTNGVAPALTLPVLGCVTTGGTGGAGLPASAAAGLAGGLITGANPFPTVPGGLGGSAATTPPTRGAAGGLVIPKLNFWYGGTGGGSTHGTSLTTGLVQAAGGDGGYGSGGGGMGGALTASAAAVISKGGAAICIIVCW